VLSAPAGERQQRAAGSGQGDMVARALEQNNPELALEAPDELADRGLDDAQALRGATEVQLIGDRDKGGELAQLHPATIAGRDRSQCAMAIAGRVDRV
jgi:hypothetical protein